MAGRTIHRSCAQLLRELVDDLIDLSFGLFLLRVVEQGKLHRSVRGDQRSE